MPWGLDINQKPQISLLYRFVNAVFKTILSSFNISTENTMPERCLSSLITSPKQTSSELLGRICCMLSFQETAFLKQVNTMGNAHHS